MHAYFHVRTVVVSVLLASMCAASPPDGGRESAEHVQPSVSKAIPEVAKLFQRGKEPFVSDAMKALLVACVTELDAEQRFDNQSEKFYRCVERLRRYLDTHRILASGIRVRHPRFWHDRAGCRTCQALGNSSARPVCRDLGHGE